LGMQVLIEGLALAAFGVIRDITTKPLPKQILAYVMQDEARHVAFGRLALRAHYKELTSAERREREDFVIEGCYLMRDRIRGREIWTNFGIDPKEVDEMVENSPYMRMFQSLLFSRIVPCVKDIGLWSDRIRQTYDDMGVLDMSKADLDALMSQDEEIADKLDTERFAAEEAARKAEVDAVIAEAAEGRVRLDHRRPGRPLGGLACHSPTSTERSPSSPEPAAESAAPPPWRSPAAARPSSPRTSTSPPRSRPSPWPRRSAPGASPTGWTCRTRRRWRRSPPRSRRPTGRPTSSSTTPASRSPARSWTPARRPGTRSSAST